MATPVSVGEDGDWVEGEVDDSEVPGTPFACVLFLPQGDDQPSPRGGRQVKRPTLLYKPTDTGGGTIALSAEQELLVVAGEHNIAQGLAADAEVRWQVSTAPQPFGKPGKPVIGFQATLVRVED